ncbi:MAG: metal ABC transporter substrate-binding protein [Myxococcota bacterium]|nr:metal ABC transporter substrate-binding protein [Myxococcota bacterium]
MFRSTFFRVLFGSAILAAAPASAAAGLRVVTTITDFAQIAREVGGDLVETTAFCRSTQDPHFVDARPSFVVDLSNADLLIYAGAELEVGWLPPLIRAANNGRILPGQVGHLNVSTVVPIKEVPPGTVDRSSGDIHPLGNPHTWLDPRNGLRIAIAITGRLKALDPDHAETYEANLRDFARRLGEKMNRWQEMLAPHRGARVIVYHKSWIYFLEWAGMVEVAAIEPIPGIPPADSDVTALIESHRNGGVALVVGESFYPSDRITFVAEALGVPGLRLPPMSGGSQHGTYIDVLDHNVRRIVEALDSRRRGAAPQAPPGGEGR